MCICFEDHPLGKGQELAEVGEWPWLWKVNMVSISLPRLAFFPHSKDNPVANLEGTAREIRTQPINGQAFSTRLSQRLSQVPSIALGSSAAIILLWLSLAGKRVTENNSKVICIWERMEHSAQPECSREFSHRLLRAVKLEVHCGILFSWLVWGNNENKKQN